MSSFIRLFALVSTMLVATTQAGERSLDVAKAKKQEVRYSQIGPRNTLVFYTFENERAVLRLAIDNNDTTMPVRGTVFLFADDVTAVDLGKWLNNQHSDGIYPEVPEPVSSHKIQADACKVTEKTAGAVQISQFNQARFVDYKIKLAVEAVTVTDKFSLKAFTVDTAVFVKDGKTEPNREIKRRGAARVGPAPQQ